MSGTPQKFDPDFDEVKFTAQKRAELMALHPGKSEAQIKMMVEKSLKNEKKRLLSTSKPSTNQRNLNNSQRRYPSSAQRPSYDNDPKKQLFPSEEDKIVVVVPEENADLEAKMPEENVPGSVKGTPKKRKTKRIHKDSTKSKEHKVSQYVSFFRYYNKQLHLEHPRWSNHQVNAIIYLLWRKKKLSNKMIHPDLALRHRRLRNPVTGRKYFGDLKRKQEEMEAQEIKDIWRRLPQQTRNYLRRLGQGGDGYSHVWNAMPRHRRADTGESVGLVTFRRSRRQAPVPIQNSLFSFMNKF